MFKIYWQFYSQFTMLMKLINFLHAASSFLFRHLQRKSFSSVFEFPCISKVNEYH